MRKSAWLLLALSLAALPWTSALGQPPRLHIQLGHQKAGVWYDYDKFLRHLETLPPPSTPDLVVTENDVESLQADPWPTSRYIFTLKTEAAARLEGYLEKGHTEIFAVSLDGATLFKGLVYPEIGAAAIRLPVLHYSSRLHPRQLRLGSLQGVFYGLTPDPASRLRINPPQLQEFLSQRWTIAPIKPR